MCGEAQGEGLVLSQGGHRHRAQVGGASCPAVHCARRTGHGHRQGWAQPYLRKTEPRVLFYHSRTWAAHTQEVLVLVKPHGAPDL